MTAFVSVGNGIQPFTRLLSALPALGCLPKPVVVQHGNTPFRWEGCTAIPFLEMEEFSRYVSEAELLILHAGSGSVIHAVQAGKVPVVMPRMRKYGEIVDDHQVEFARALQKAGKVVVAAEPADLAGAVEEALSRRAAGRAEAGPPRLIGLVGESLRRIGAIGNRGFRRSG